MNIEDLEKKWAETIEEIARKLTVLPLNAHPEWSSDMYYNVRLRVAWLLAYITTEEAYWATLELLQKGYQQKIAKKIIKKRGHSVKFYI